MNNQTQVSSFQAFPSRLDPVDPAEYSAERKFCFPESAVRLMAESRKQKAASVRLPLGSGSAAEASIAVAEVVERPRLG